MEARCMRCKIQVEIKDPESVVMKNGRPATKGVCPTCGTKVFRINKASQLNWKEQIPSKDQVLGSIPREVTLPQWRNWNTQRLMRGNPPISVEDDGSKVFGPYHDKRQNRIFVVIYHKDGYRKSTSYAKWYVEKYWRKLLPEEEVDHKDNNPMNNEPSNFQILHRIDNKKKSFDKSYYQKIGSVGGLAKSKSRPKGVQVRILLGAL